MAKYVPPSSSLRVVWLGQRLKALRESNNMTLKHAAAYLQRDPSTVGRFESGEYPIRRPDLTCLLDLYKVHDLPSREGYLDLCTKAWQTGWWDGYLQDAAGTLIDLAWVEDLASEIELYNAVLVPGLLQTHSYAERVMRVNEPDVSDAKIRSWLDLRMTRQQILDRPEPQPVSVILDEAALRRHFGDRDVMRAELRHLIEMSQRPAMDIRVLPLEAEAHSSATGEFMIFTLPAPLHRAAYVETIAGNIYVESEKTGPIEQAYDRLATAALDPAETVDRIEAIAKEM